MFAVLKVIKDYILRCCKIFMLPMSPTMTYMVVSHGPMSPTKTNMVISH